MNKNNLYSFIILCIGFLFSCEKNKPESFTQEPLRDFQEQYNTDIQSIENFLKTHTIEKDESTGETEVNFVETTDIEQSLFKSNDLKSFETSSDLRSTVRTDAEFEDKVKYKIYYIILNEGEGESPTTIDSTFTSYKGQTLDKKIFDLNNNYLWFSYPDVAVSISGYRQFIPQLKAASKTINPDGSTTYGKSGSGIVFIPSALGYYNETRTNIPAYSPLIFRIRLKTFKERDHDLDGILTKEEYLVANGPFDPKSDTDGDKIPDFLDQDDDGDGKTTKKEVIRNADGTVTKPDCNNNQIPDYLDKTNCN
jgi:FKBP-type peptidyl-prolyl cis-trans isomerase FkpA